jgi:nicotinamide mononucleotide adenylyltransferase
MNFKLFLQKSKDQLDISILNADKYLTSKSKIETLLSFPVEIEQKTDGVKLTIVKIGNKGSIDDYIFSYKGNVLYTNEYNHCSYIKIKEESIGASQFKLVFEHFMKLDKNSIPEGTELFIEFLMNKPTLSSNYKRQHKMVLIGYSESMYSVSFGKLKTQNSGMKTELRTQYAKELKIDIPRLLFNGILGSKFSFSNGIVNNHLKKEFSHKKLSMHWDNPELLINDIKELFLDIPSKYGGKEEGVIIKSDNNILKWIQNYQLDQEARLINKMKYREDNPQDETKYWENVKSSALEIANSITVKSRKLNELLEELSLAIKSYKLNYHHSKKTDFNIKDDIQLSSKTLIIKKMRNNNNALVIGKFKILSKDGHVKLIKRAQNLYDNVIIALITSKDTENTKKLRIKMIQKTFPGIEIIFTGVGNLQRIIEQSPININVVYCGSDRVNAYREQLKNTQGVDVKEMARDDNDISSTKIIQNIKNKEFFEKNTPESIHQFYNQLKTIYT